MKTKVKRVMSQVFDVPIESVTDDASPETIDSWSSLAHLNLVMALEDEFGIRFTDDQIPTLVSCTAIADAVTKASVGRGAS
jgi:acyl carrier protein